MFLPGNHCRTCSDHKTVKLYDLVIGIECAGRYHDEKIDQHTHPRCPNATRLDGLDLARFLAFAGLVSVNFKVVTGAWDAATAGTSAAAGPGALGILVGALEGRAAATFVVQAGVGLGLVGLREINRTTAVTIRRPSSWRPSVSNPF